jgi:hypothetical protein
MKPLCLPAVVLAASLGVAAGSEIASAPAPAASAPGVAAADPSSATGCSLHWDAEERAALREAERRDADLADLKAGFFLEDHDVVLVVGTVVVVVLIALLL